MSSVAQFSLRGGVQGEIIPIGTPFGKLTVISGPFCMWPRRRPARTCYRCLCECGETADVSRNNLITGNSTTCGCGKRNAARTHGGHAERLYRIRGLMIRRCCSTKCRGYRNYGGRGIRICEEWLRSYEAFRSWALAHGYRDDLTIERLDVDGHYEPGNCTWIPLPDQLRNMRKTVRLTAFGETKCVSEWARDPRCRVSLNALFYRASQGWDDVLAITTPPAPPNMRRRKVTTGRA